MSAKPDVPKPKLAKLAELAGIKEGPYPLIVRLPGGLDFVTTLRAQFDNEIIASVQVAHSVAAMLNAKAFSRRKAIAKLASELAKTLEASDENLLAHFLPNGWTVGLYLMAMNELANAAKDIETLAKAKRLGQSTTLARKLFVKRLIDASQRAGGRLTINRSKEGGSLVDAINLLKPHLPKGIASKLSFASVRRIYDSWLRNVKNGAKKTRN